MPNPWSIPRAVLQDRKGGFSLRCIHRRAASSRWVVAAAGPKSHGFLVSFAEPGAIAPVLIPLDTDGKGFCRELLIGYLDLRS